MKRGSSALPWATARKRPIPRSRQARAIQHRELETGLARDLLSDVGKPLGGEIAGRLVDQVAGLADGARGLLRRA